MPLGFASPIPPIPKGFLGIAQRFSVGKCPTIGLVPKGRLTLAPSFSRPFGTASFWSRPPNVETLGYSHMSLRDTGLRGILPQAPI